jgi:NADH-quinone oxidoreductase subunit M
MTQEFDFYNTLLNILIFLPLVGIPPILLAPRSMAKYLGLGFSLLPLVLSLVIFGGWLAYGEASMKAGPGGFAFYRAVDWLGSARLDITFATGIDGISIYLILLTALLFPLSIFFSWNSIDDDFNVKGYYALLLLLLSGVFGVFVALDLIVFYIFFEVGLIPMYFLIGIWGGKDKIYAAIKFFLYTLVGSFLMLVAILYIGYQVGGGTAFTSDYLKILAKPEAFAAAQGLLFLGFFASFAIKVPMFPVHTWLPDAHVQAPTAGSVILAGILLKMGTYGIIRFCLPLFPQASVDYAPVISVLALIGITYGAMAAMVQTDIKKLVAYSSVAHMGFVVLGLFAFTKEALSGAVIQMINHGVSTPALFLLIGMIYDRRHTREIKDYQGIATVVPMFTLLFMISTMASVGLPGLNGFVGEFLILLGSFKSGVIPGWVTVVATTGVIVAAVYMLWMVRRVFFGELDKRENQELSDLTKAEVWTMMPLIILMFVLGFYPVPFLHHINLSSDRIVDVLVKAVPTLAGLN